MKKILILVLFASSSLQAMKSQPSATSRSELSRSASPVVAMARSNRPYILHNMSEKSVKDVLGNEYRLWHNECSVFISIKGMKKIFSGSQNPDGGTFKINEFFTEAGEKIIVHNIEEFNLSSQEPVQLMESSLDSSSDDSFNSRIHPVHTKKEEVVKDAMENKYKIFHSEIGNALVRNLKTKKSFSGKKCPRGPIERTNEFFTEDGARYVVYNLEEIASKRN